MKTKKILLGVSILIIAFIVGSMQNIVFATNATTPLYLGITELRTNSEPNMGYSINNPNAGGKYIWNILEYTSSGDNASLKADVKKSLSSFILNICKFILHIFTNHSPIHILHILL